jgi:uncharacterized protein (TIGR03083 family)
MTVDPSIGGPLPVGALLGHLRAEAAGVVTALRGAAVDPGTPVPTCPDWDVAALIGHLGWVHRWATVAITTGEMPDRSAIARPEAGIGAVELAGWFGDGVEALCSALDGADPTADTWHPFPARRNVGFWHRRLAHETTIHRVDLERALGHASPVDAILASDGIDEYLCVIVPMLVGSGRVTLPDSTLHIHCTDVPGEWMIRPTDGAPVVSREHAKGDAALRGPAADVLLALWGRADDPVEVVGSRSAAATWLAIGGN